MDETANVTRLLIDWRSGNQQVLYDLMPMVQGNLDIMARQFMRG